nr:dihydrofolate reductase-like [Pseudochaenichthys georgianus]
MVNIFRMSLTFKHLCTHSLRLSVMMCSLLWVTQELMQFPGTRRLFVTRIMKQFECDTFLPEISLDRYRLLPQFPGVPPELQEENGIQYRFEVYESIDELCNLNK